MSSLTRGRNAFQQRGPLSQGNEDAIAFVKKPKKNKSGAVRRRPLGILDLNRSSSSLGSASISARQKAKATKGRIDSKSTKQALASATSQPQQPLASRQSLRTRPSVTTDEADSTTQPSLSHGLSSTSSASLQIFEEGQPPLTAPLSASTDSIFRSQDSDLSGSSFWDGETGDMLTLKRANPIYESSDEEEEDDSHYWSPPKRRRSGDGGFFRPSFDMDNLDSLVDGAAATRTTRPADEILPPPTLIWSDHHVPEDEASGVDLSVLVEGDSGPLPSR